MTSSSGLAPAANAARTSAQFISLMIVILESSSGIDVSTRSMRQFSIASGSLQYKTKF